MKSGVKNLRADDRFSSAGFLRFINFPLPNFTILKFSPYRNPLKNVMTFFLENIDKFSLISSKMDKFSPPPRDRKFEVTSRLDQTEISQCNVLTSHSDIFNKSRVRNSSHERDIFQVSWQDACQGYLHRQISISLNVETL